MDAMSIIIGDGVMLMGGTKAEYQPVTLFFFHVIYGNL